MTEYLNSLLNIKYKQLLNLESIINISTNTLFLNNVTYTSNLFVTQQTICNNMTCKANLSAYYLLSNNITCFANVNTNLLSSQNINCASNIQTSDIKIDNILQVNNIITNTYNNTKKLYSNNILQVNNVFTNNITSDSILFNNLNINIGTQNSVINLYGNINSIIVSNLGIAKKELTLNNNKLSENLSGIFIETFTPNKGYLQLADDLNSFNIKAPLGVPSKILQSDSNDNIIISGSSLIRTNFTQCGILYSSNLNFSNITLNSRLNILGDCIITNSNTQLVTNRNLHITQNTTIFNVTSNSIQCKTIVQNNNCTIYNMLNNNSSILVCGNININSDGNTILSSSSILFVSNRSIFNSNLTCNSTLYTTSNSVIQNNLTSVTFMTNNLSTNNITTNSSIRASNMVLFNPHTINCPISIANFYCNKLNLINNSRLNMYGNACIYNIPEYMTNNEASNNIPIGCFYRTGGILKIRV